MRATKTTKTIKPFSAAAKEAYETALFRYRLGRIGIGALGEACDAYYGGPYKHPGAK